MSAATVLRRLHFQRACGSKIRHASRGKAEAHIRHLVQRDMVRRGELVAYLCPNPRCGSWHVGHAKRRVS